MLSKQVDNLPTYTNFKIKDCIKRRTLAQKKSEGLAEGIQSLQRAWRCFGDILKAFRKCIPHVKKALRKGERMLALLNSRIKQQNVVFQKLNFFSKEEFCVW